MSNPRLRVARRSLCTTSPLRSATARSSIWQYKSKPTDSICPCCSSQNISGATQFQIERGDAKAGAQIAEFLKRGEPLAREPGERAFWRHKQISVSALRRASHAPTKLVEFRQTEAVCAIDDNRIGARNIQAIFDNRCRHQHVRF